MHACTKIFKKSASAACILCIALRALVMRMRLQGPAAGAPGRRPASARWHVHWAWAPGQCQDPRNSSHIGLGPSGLGGL